MPGPVDAVERTSDGLAGSFRQFCGFHVDSAVAAVVEFRDGSALGKLLATSRLAGAGDDGPFFFPRAITTAGGVWVEIVSGTPTVIVYGI